MTHIAVLVGYNDIHLGVIWWCESLLILKSIDLHTAIGIHDFISLLDGFKDDLFVVIKPH
jgi:hypothetical protein